MRAFTDRVAIRHVDGVPLHDGASPLGAASTVLTGYRWSHVLRYAAISQAPPGTGQLSASVSP